MMRIVVLSMMLVALPALAAGRGAVENLLKGYEFRPDKAALDAASPSAFRVLMQIAGDPGATNLERGRAIQALTLYPNDEVWKWFVSAVNETGNETGNEILRRRAVDAMCETFAGRRRDAVEAVVAPLLESPDAHLRVRAARCLAKVGGAKADAALARYRHNIKASWEARAASASEGNRQ